METFKISFEVTLDAKGDSINPKDWCDELKETIEKEAPDLLEKQLKKHYYLVEFEKLEIEHLEKQV
jgi:hypothetical protein